MCVAVCVRACMYVSACVCVSVCVCAKQWNRSTTSDLAHMWISIFQVLSHNHVFISISTFYKEITHDLTNDHY